jgi:hypothetical protein
VNTYDVYIDGRVRYELIVAEEADPYRAFVSSLDLDTGLTFELVARDLEETVLMRVLFEYPELED